MTSATTYGREPIQIVELRQPRCRLTYGTLPCRASTETAEPRTNFLLWSQDIGNAVWNVGSIGGARTVDAGTAPDATTTADQITENTATQARLHFQTVSFTSGAVYTLSAYVKRSAGTRHAGLSLPPAGFGTLRMAQFNLTTPSASMNTGVGTASIETLADGWFRISVTATATATASGAAAFRMSNSPTAPAANYAGDGTSGLLWWGAQIEVGTPASSYKTTEAEAVTRIWGTGTRKCYNTFGTCQDTENYDGTGEIRWRFAKPEAGILPLYNEAGDLIETNPMYMLQSVSTAPTRVNLGTSRQGESPFGVRGEVTIGLRDQNFDDHVGDPYLSERGTVTGTFWGKWVARNPFYPGATVKVYEGYRGQSLASMQSRLYVLSRVDGPDAQGNVTLRGSDPLQLSDRRRAMFPRATDMRLRSAVGVNDTTIGVVATVADVTAAFGNTGDTRFARIGSEVFSYTGYTGTAPNITLTGVRRGVLNTVASEHSRGDGVQRVGRYDRMKFWRVAYDLLTEHSTLPASFIDLDQWDAEGGKFLNTFNTSATITEPTAVETLIGELCRDGLFSIWWDERAQTIPLLALRPPQEDPVVISDEINILAGSATLTTKPDDRLTRVSVYYGRFDPTKALDDPVNYTRRRVRIDGPSELADATGGEIREQQIYSRWIGSDAQAVLLGAQILLRYKSIPRYLQIRVDAKDREITIGDVVDATTRVVVDDTGASVQSRWQVISWEETRPGDTIALDLQSYTFIGRFGYYMADGSPDYNSATDEQKDTGGFYADDQGRLPDGTKGYQYQ